METENKNYKYSTTLFVFSEQYHTEGKARDMIKSLYPAKHTNNSMLIVQILLSTDCSFNKKKNFDQK